MNEAYHDAFFYDKKHQRRIQRMKEISRDIWNIGKKRTIRKMETLSIVRQEIEEIYDEFKREEKL